MILEDYLDLVPTSNMHKPKFMAFLEMLISSVTEIGALAESISQCFDLDNAAGNQLDMLGELLGLPRLCPVEINTPYYDENNNPVYTREMTDDEYIYALRLKIEKNEWDGTNFGANEAYTRIFDTGMHINQIDKQDGTVDIIVYEYLDTRMLEILSATRSFLIPAGVSVGTISFSGTEVETAMTIGTQITGLDQVNSVIAT